MKTLKPSCPSVRARVFRDDPDRLRCLVNLAEGCAKTDRQVHAYCLIGDHFLLALEQPQSNLVVE
jgi:hypothetical protein